MHMPTGATARTCLVIVVGVADHGHMLRKLGDLQCRVVSTRKSPRCLNVQDRNGIESPASLLHKAGQGRHQDRTSILLRIPPQDQATMGNMSAKLLLNRRKQRGAGGLIQVESDRHRKLRPFCDKTAVTVNHASQPWSCRDKSRRQLVMVIQPAYAVMVGLR